MQRRRNILLLVAILILVIIGALTYRTLHRPNTTVKLAPSAATMTLDGQKNIVVGNTRLSPGKHTITATMNGFATTKKTFDVPSTGNTTVIIILEPNSQVGQDYLKKYPKEEYLREQLGGELFRTTSTKVAAANPIIKLLPYVASDHTYRVDYGAGTNKNTLTQTIYITAVDSTADAAARHWIQSKGYNLDSLNLVSTIEPMLTHLPYQTTDFTLKANFVNGPNNQPKLTMDAIIQLSAADKSNESIAVANYKQEVFNYITSVGVNPDAYTINYIVQ